MMKVMKEYSVLQKQLKTSFDNQVRVEMNEDCDTLTDLCLTVTIVPNHGPYACARAMFEVRFNDGYAEGDAPNVKSIVNIYHANICSKEQGDG